MDDRELLEKAARAAGMTYRDDLWDGGHVQRPDHLWAPWNTLTERGDALQLAADLHMTVAIKPHEVEVFDYESGECLVSLPVWHKSVMAPGCESDSPVVVACRAITMAAARLADLNARDPGSNA